MNEPKKPNTLPEQNEARERRANEARYVLEQLEGDIFDTADYHLIQSEDESKDDDARD